MSSPAPRALLSDASVPPRRSGYHAIMDAAGSRRFGKNRIADAALSRLPGQGRAAGIRACHHLHAQSRGGDAQPHSAARCRAPREFSDEEISARLPHEQQSLQLARAVLDTSAALGWNILDHPARLQVRTLDSFCESVAQRAPFKGLLGGVAQVTEDAQPLYELAAQRVIDQLADFGHAGRCGRKLARSSGQRRTRRARSAGRDACAARPVAALSRTFRCLRRIAAAKPAKQSGSGAGALGRRRTCADSARITAALNSAQTTELFALMRYSADQLADGMTASER